MYTQTDQHKVTGQASGHNIATKIDTLNVFYNFCGYKNG